MQVHERWRLILGPPDEPQGEQSGGDPGSGVLTGDAARMDDLLAAVYPPAVTFDEDAAQDGTGPLRLGGSGAGAGRVASWLAEIRAHFDADVVALLQRDAVRRVGLEALLGRPEVLSALAPSVDLAAMLLLLRAQVPETSRAAARRVVNEVVRTLRQRLEAPMGRAIVASVRRGRGAAPHSLANVDWHRTIAANLRHYQPHRRVLVPQTLKFVPRQPRPRAWHVIVCLDQSASMAESVVHGAVLASVLAGIPALTTDLLVFDTAVVDLSDRAADAVDVLFGVQLGGGTDLGLAMRHASSRIRDPHHTVIVVVSDLFDGGDPTGLIRAVEDRVSEGVTVVFLLAVSDHGTPAHDVSMAGRLRTAGATCRACEPASLPDLIGAVLRGESPAE